MGRAVALGRLDRGDRVVVIGSNADKGRHLLAAAAERDADDRIEFIQADLSRIADVRGVIERIRSRYEVVDALCLFANRQVPRRIVTDDGVEKTFALYYLSRYLLSHELAPLLRRSDSPVIVNVAGVGVTKGEIYWDDVTLAGRYNTIRAQLQAGRANDLLGVAFAAQSDNPIRYVLYHPGFTKSGDLGPLPAPVRGLLRVASLIAARPVEEAVAPVHGFIDGPPGAPLTAIDRGRSLPLTLSSLDPDNAARLAELTAKLLAGRQSEG
ncbi:short subunit dehydrogenase [Stackebrandtia endophytica]|uniref:Short subunit dehydrogenase n=2 Tax=Stackebrandtia endophytica TaxID=1496996 RepID=A0A543ARA8_9ACTN|nr:short subunit dehydrogenase [Stackebrandtia endophytica]